MPSLLTHVKGHLVCGVDEAGRGPWAGPVYTAAVILPQDHKIDGLNDSKLLSTHKRETLALAIKTRAISWSVAYASVEEIDHLNIRRATFLAMNRAISNLDPKPEHALIDGRDVPDNCPVSARAVIGGDGTEPAISAASILAKTSRDLIMLEMDNTFPGYGFAQHKGYGTAQHRSALDLLGPCAIHRKSFKPIARLL